MWAVATRLCDHVIFTEDENYHEDGLLIMQAMAEGVEKKYKEKYELVQDRAAAIKHALKIANSWDIVVVTGMANFTTRAMNTWEISRNEKQVIQQAMRDLDMEVIDGVN